MTDEKIIQVAIMCHQVNKSWCEQNNDFSQVSWGSASDAQRNSAIAGVKYRLEHPDSTPENQHESWVEYKVNDGWTHGDVKDETAKTHPCIVPYSELPEFQKIKDKLFASIVNVFI